MDAQGLFMFVLVPPAMVAAKVDAERRQFAANYGAVRALRHPVHLTVLPPFRADEALLQSVLGRLRAWCAAEAPVEITLKNFGFFEQGKSPVVFLDVLRTPALTALHAAFTRKARSLLNEVDFGGGRSTQFHPHFTLGYRDVDRGLLPDIQRAYQRRPFEERFCADTIWLWVHRGGGWQPLVPLPLGEAARQQSSLF